MQEQMKQLGRLCRYSFNIIAVEVCMVCKVAVLYPCSASETLSEVKLEYVYTTALFVCSL